MIPFTLWATVWLPSPAAACGGFFCNSSAPVEQTGEDIFFYVDEAAGTVSAHIEIEYQGPSEDFAWIVPVATLPEVGVGADELFTLLAANLSPLFTLQIAVEGECKSDGKGVINFAGSSFYSSDETYVTSGGVTVVDQVAVGPYDAVTLLADSTTALLDWLTEHGYDLPPAIETADAAMVYIKLHPDAAPAIRGLLLGRNLLMEAIGGGTAMVCGFAMIAMNPSLMQSGSWMHVKLGAAILGIVLVVGSRVGFHPDRIARWAFPVRGIGFLLAVIAVVAMKVLR